MRDTTRRLRHHFGTTQANGLPTSVDRTPRADCRRHFQSTGARQRTELRAPGRDRAGGAVVSRRRRHACDRLHRRRQTLLLGGGSDGPRRRISGADRAAATPRRASANASFTPCTTSTRSRRGMERRGDGRRRLHRHRARLPDRRRRLLHAVSRDRHRVEPDVAEPAAVHAAGRRRARKTPGRGRRTRLRPNVVAMGRTRRAGTARRADGARHRDGGALCGQAADRRADDQAQRERHRGRARPRR